MVPEPLSTAARLVAATGPVTAFVEAAAASVGAGMVLGGFLAGLLGLASRRGVRDREQATLDMASFGGLAMAVGLIIEAIVR
jgi:hypothetical protein